MKHDPATREFKFRGQWIDEEDLPAAQAAYALWLEGEAENEDFNRRGIEGLQKITARAT